jgi:hypothetical protein
MSTAISNLQSAIHLPSHVKGKPVEWSSGIYNNGTAAPWRLAPLPAQANASGNFVTGSLEMFLENVAAGFDGRGGTVVSQHTHTPGVISAKAGGGEVFSSDDLTASNNAGVDMMVLTPSGRVIRHKAESRGKINAQMQSGEYIGQFSADGQQFTYADGHVTLFPHLSVSGE